ncbi:hypothetical protein IPN35_00875 [Candidatus Peregrinibacteria bacterium]|nr:MAG: hypothetical protein IPN35_00875 [Candidatus Peregrinibacteria bacterium]
MLEYLRLEGEEDDFLRVTKKESAECPPAKEQIIKMITDMVGVGRCSGKKIQEAIQRAKNDGEDVGDSEKILKKCCHIMLTSARVYLNAMLRILETDIKIGFPYEDLVNGVGEVRRAMVAFSENPFVTEEEVSLYQERFSDCIKLIRKMGQEEGSSLQE